jgi:hypothetical protein
MENARKEAASRATANKNFMEKVLMPVHQSIWVICGALALMVIVKVLEITKFTDVDTQFYWTISGMSILFFALFNSIVSLNASDMNKYWTHSTLCYVGVMFASGGLAFLFSQRTISEAGSYRWIFTVLTFSYLLFLSLMRFIRKVVIIAQKEDDSWTKRMK